ncbi:MAG: amidohydrolase [Gammaproteobacteria bacterium]|nr:MAG: amidohydrolase [Gammaproteobacteria bacterium]
MKFLAFLFLVVFACRSLSADEKKSDLPLEPTRTISFETDEATWLSLDVSPDGHTLVLEILGDLYTLPIEGGEAIPLTTGMQFDSQPRFSPDGQKLTFISDRDGKENVWIMGVDGSGLKKLSKGGDRIEFASPTWSPDSSHVVVSRTSWGLRTFELWAYHVDGGKGVQLTKAKAAKNTPINQRSNSLGAVYTPDGKYLYYARKNGGFGYNVNFPMWQIARRDLTSGLEDILTLAQGSAIRPLLSPDGKQLVYGTRFEHNTGLRIRNLETGEDKWLVYPIQRDDQESRFTRDLLPGYAFTPDGTSVIYTAEGGIRRVAIATGAVTEIAFTAKVEQGLGPRLYFPHRLGVGPVKSRMIGDPVLSPDGTKVAFSAFMRLYVHEFASGTSEVVSPEGLTSFQPTWSPDGRNLAFVSWSQEGGHIWRMRAGGGRARMLTEYSAYYTSPAWSPDGKRIVALRATSYERMYREGDFGQPVGADVIWLPADGGAVEVIIPSRGLGVPHFGVESDRIYLYLGGGPFGNAGASGLVSLRYDGTDRRNVISLKGPGIYRAEENVPAEDMRMSPNGRYVLMQHANQLYVSPLLNPNLQNVAVDLASPSIPLAKLTDVGVDFFGWSKNGEDIYWSVGHHVYRRPVESVIFDDEAGDDEEDDDSAFDSGSEPESGSETEVEGEAEAPQPLAEDHESVTVTAVEIYMARFEPEGTLALVGATIIPMETDDDRIEDGVVILQAGRISAVGRRADVVIPEEADVVDVTGKFIVPGYVDTHAHYRPLRNLFGLANPAFLANLAYGVTTGIDVQPSTTDILAYQDMIDAGLMLGPRALSTGPGIFSNNAFKSREHALAVLRRYKDHYRVNNLKAYISGSRKQRQWLLQAAEELQLMPTTEGSLDMKLDLTHVIDGFSGNEHNFPIVDLYTDTVQLVARSGLAYTPTLLVTYGGPWAETYYYTRENPHGNAKLRRFTPDNVLASRTLRVKWFHDDEYTFSRVAAQAAKIIRAGGRVGVGAHGQLQGLGYHWELWSLASGGLTPREALRAATRHGAEMIGIAQDVGTVSEGKLADLVILRSDPLENIRNSVDISAVVKGGELFDGDTLDKRWPVVEPLPDQWWWHTGPSASPRE